VRRVGLLSCAALVAATAALAPVPAPAGAQGGGAFDDRLGEVLDTTSPGESPANLTFTPSGLPATPDDYGVSAAAALATADADPKIVARKEGLAAGDEEDLTATVTAEAVRVWEVGYFLGGDKVNLVVVDGGSGEVTESWTGAAVDWPMARGHEGQFGHVLNAPWVWGPLAGIFLLGLWDFRRWRKWVHLDLLVLLSFGLSQAFFNAAEIGISVPLAYPPMLYLLGRMLWIGFRGGGAGTAGEGLRPSAPLWLLAAAVVGLIGLRVAANIADSGVIDVGYAGVVGADKITDAEPIYGDSAFPPDNPTGDTYGPANYFAYVPFEGALPWSGAWDELPAAHAAAIFFDLATGLGLFVLGRLLVRRRLGGEGDGDADGPGGSPSAGDTPGYHRDSEGYRGGSSPVGAIPGYRGDSEDAGGGEGAGSTQGYSGVEPDGGPSATTDPAGSTQGYPAAESPPHTPRPGRGLGSLRPRLPAASPANALGLTLAFAWVAYPYTAFALQSNSNDALLSALLVWSLVAFASPLARGGLLAVAALTKFAPLVLVPLYAAGENGIRLRSPQARHALLRPLALFCLAFVAGSILLLAHPAVDPGLADFYDRTIRSQVERVSPFSIWGQADLEWLHTATKVGAVALGLAVAFVPRRRSLVQIAALGAAVIIAVQLTVEHWFYLYIPWFLPMLLVALVATRRPPAGERAPT